MSGKLSGELGDNEFLQVGSYTPRRARRAIPLATIKQPQALSQFA
jgi:hypothetical protein